MIDQVVDNLKIIDYIVNLIVMVSIVVMNIDFTGNLDISSIIRCQSSRLSLHLGNYLKIHLHHLNQKKNKTLTLYSIESMGLLLVFKFNSPLN